MNLTKGEKGFDLSHWNIVEDFKKIKDDANGYTFGIVKTTQGTIGLDPKALYNATGIVNVGLKLGLYHYCTLDTHDVIRDAVAEAKNFAAHIRELPSCQAGIWLDFEENAKKLSPQECNSWLLTFFTELTAESIVNYGIYGGKYFLEANLPKYHDFRLLPLWHPQYPPNGITETSKPNIADGWDNAKIWQYSCTGHIDGIKGSVDLNLVLT